jgi:calmodulin
MKPFGHAPTDAELADMIAEIEADGIGEIDFPEFVILMGKYMKDSDTEDELVSAWNAMDKDKSGGIDGPEMKLMMNSLGEKINEDEINDMIKMCDVDKDGIFSFEDFVKVMMGR